MAFAISALILDCGIVWRNSKSSINLRTVPRQTSVKKFTFITTAPPLNDPLSTPRLPTTVPYPTEDLRPVPYQTAKRVPYPTAYYIRGERARRLLGRRLPVAPPLLRHLGGVVLIPRQKAKTPKRKESAKDVEVPEEEEEEEQKQWKKAPMFEEVEI